VWVIFAIAFLVVFVTGGGSLDTVLESPWDFFLPVVFGLVVGLGIGPVILLVRWALGKMPKEIHATLNGEGVKIFGEAVNYEAKWPSVIWVREGRSAYLIRFKALWFRLPKRGFAPEQEASFRSLVLAVVPAPSNRLRR
jgi:hypothetical protein